MNELEVEKYKKMNLHDKKYEIEKTATSLHWLFVIVMVGIIFVLVDTFASTLIGLVLFSAGYFLHWKTTSELNQRIEKL